jgi:hypothetical protein
MHLLKKGSREVAVDPGTAGSTLTTTWGLRRKHIPDPPPRGLTVLDTHRCESVRYRCDPVTRVRERWVPDSFHYIAKSVAHRETIRSLRAGAPSDRPHTGKVPCLHIREESHLTYGQQSHNIYQKMRTHIQQNYSMGVTDPGLWPRNKSHRRQPKPLRRCYEP